MSMFEDFDHDDMDFAYPGGTSASLMPWNGEATDMKITRTSGFTGIERTMDLPITEEQLEAWHNGQLIQNVMPHLSPDQREFLMTGVTAEEWDKAFKK